MNTEQLRKVYHEMICQQVLGYRAGVPNIADKGSKRSIELAQGILTRMGFPPCPDPPKGQRAGALFESLTLDYLEKAFRLIQHLRPSDWTFSVHGDVTAFDQYEHLTDLTGFGATSWSACDLGRLFGEARYCHRAKPRFGSANQSGS